MRTWAGVAAAGRKIPGAAEVNQEEKLDGNDGDKEGAVKDDSEFSGQETSCPCNILVITCIFSLLPFLKSLHIH